jgi:SAM-dependent methyltransferase
MGRNSYDVEAKVESFHWWFAVRKRILKTILSSAKFPPESLALDIGCGTGSNLRTIESGGFNVIGLDRSLYALYLTQQKFKYPLINGDLNRLPLKIQSVGLIIAFDILEHLENDSNGIKEFYNALQRKGVLILTVPAFKFLWGIQDIVTGHKRRYTRKEILMKLRQGGFEVLRTSYFNFFLFFPIFLARRMIHLLGVKIVSENEVNFPILNFFLKVIFSLEPFLLRYFSFPFGVSIFCIAQKK